MNTSLFDPALIGIDPRGFAVLAEDEERDLVVRWQEHGDRAALERLVTSHLRLVNKIARRFSGYGIGMSELVSEGYVGLMQAVERFDPAKGFRFSTYARWWVKAAILNFVLQSWSLIKVGNSASKKRLFFNLNRAKKDMQLEGRRYLSDDDVAALAARFQVSPEDVRTIDERRSAADLSIDQPLGGSDGGDVLRLGDVLASEEPSVEAVLIEQDSRTWMRRLVKEGFRKLDRREKEILTRRYLTERPATLAKLAKVYGITAERVRQIEAGAIGKLKNALAPRAAELALGAI